MKKNIKILMAKPGLDGHDRGIKILARAYRDSGMDVIYLGLRQTPQMIVNAAIQEDVDVIALSILSGAHMTIFPKVVNMLKEQGETNDMKPAEKFNKKGKRTSLVALKEAIKNEVRSLLETEDNGDVDREPSKKELTGIDKSIGDKTYFTNTTYM